MIFPSTTVFVSKRVLKNIHERYYWRWFQLRMVIGDHIIVFSVNSKSVIWDKHGKRDHIKQLKNPGLPH